MAISSRNNQPTNEELFCELNEKLKEQLMDQLMRVSNKIYGKTSKAASIVVSSEVADIIKEWL